MTTSIRPTHTDSDRAFPGDAICKLFDRFYVTDLNVKSHEMQNIS